MNTPRPESEGGSSIARTCFDCGALALRSGGFTVVLLGPAPLWSTTALYRCTDCGRVIKILSSFVIALQIVAVAMMALMVPLAPFMWPFFALIAAVPAGVAFVAIRERRRNPPVTPEVAEVLEKALTNPDLIALLNNPDAREALHPESLKQWHKPGGKKAARSARTRAPDRGRP